jgi:putative flippase GtrA
MPTAADPRPAPPADDETPDERLNRNLDQLLQELRIALPGVQVLFAFLLVVPFNARFDEVTSRERLLYGVALLTAAAASAFLIAPSVHHRLLFHQHRKPQVVRLANRLAVAGMVCLVASFTTAIALGASFTFSTPIATVMASATVALFLVVWFLLPFWLRHRPPPKRP